MTFPVVGTEICLTCFHSQDRKDFSNYGWSLLYVYFLSLLWASEGGLWGGRDPPQTQSSPIAFYVHYNGGVRVFGCHYKSCTPCGNSWCWPQTSHTVTVWLGVELRASSQLATVDWKHLVCLFVCLQRGFRGSRAACVAPMTSLSLCQVEPGQ